MKYILYAFIICLLVLGVMVAHAEEQVYDTTYEYQANALDNRMSAHIVTAEYAKRQLVAEMNGQGTVMAWYVHAGLDRPLARIASDGTVHYYHTDLLGSVIALTDANGAVTTQYNYSPFGQTEVTHLTGQVEQPYQFTGKRYDAETGFLHFPYRYYYAKLRRFISEDPIRFASGEINWFSYAANNPINFTDPMGLTVYECSAPADLPFPLSMLPHKWLKTDIKEAGLGDANGNANPDGLPMSPYPETAIVDHSSREDASCKVVPDIDENKVNQLLKGSSKNSLVIWEDKVKYTCDEKRRLKEG